MAYENWKRDIVTEAGMAAMRLRGLSSLCHAWGNFQAEVGDVGPARRGDVMEALGWALDDIAKLIEPEEESEPAPDELRDPDRG